MRAPDHIDESTKHLLSQEHLLHEVSSVWRRKTVTGHTEEVWVGFVKENTQTQTRMSKITEHTHPVFQWLKQMNSLCYYYNSYLVTKPTNNSSVEFKHRVFMFFIKCTTMIITVIIQSRHTHQFVDKASFLSTTHSLKGREPSKGAAAFPTRT